MEDWMRPALLQDRAVRISGACTKYNGKYNGMIGTVRKAQHGTVGVLLLEERNPSSGYGYFWIELDHLEVFVRTHTGKIGTVTVPMYLQHRNGVFPYNFTRWSEVALQDVTHAIHEYGSFAWSCDAELPSSPLEPIGFDGVSGGYGGGGCGSSGGHVGCGSGGAGGLELHVDAIVKGCEWRERMNKVLELAKEKDLTYCNEQLQLGNEILINDDPVVVVIEDVRAEQAKTEGAVAAELSLRQKRGYCTEITLGKLSELEEQIDTDKDKVVAFYEEIAALLELPEIEPLDILVRRKVIAEDHATILPTQSRLELLEDFNF